MATGTVSRVCVDRGFGFIARPDGDDVFFHVTDLDDSLGFDETLLERHVAFEVTTDERSGKPRAVNVRPTE